MPNPKPATADIIDIANRMAAVTSPNHLPPQERRAPRGDPDNPSKREAEAFAAYDAIMPLGARERELDENDFEDIFGFSVSRGQAADFLSDILDASLVRPEHRAPLQTLARLLRRPDGEMGDPFSSWGYTSPIQPHDAYLAGIVASRDAAAFGAMAMIAPVCLGGVEVEFVAAGPRDDYDKLHDWTPPVGDDDTAFAHPGAQRFVVRFNSPADYARAEAFFRAMYGKKSITMQTPRWEALIEWRPRSCNSGEWLADLYRRAPSLRPALALGTPASACVVVQAGVVPAVEPGGNPYDVRPGDDSAPTIIDPLKRELNARVTSTIPVPYSVTVRGINGETRLVRVLNTLRGDDDDDPTPGSQVKEIVLQDAARADVEADAGGKPVRAMAALAAAGAEFFNSPNGRLWVSFQGKVHRVSEADGCAAIMGWLVKNDLVPSRTAKAELFDLMGVAAASGPTHDVHFRQAQTQGAEPAAYLNLMDAEGRGVIVDAAGWRVAPVASFPLRMSDRPKARALPVPEHACDGLTFLGRLGRHVKLPPVIDPLDPTDAGLRSRAAILMLLLAQVYRPGAVPHMFVTGPEGASKTTTARRLKALVDPDSVPLVTSMPKEAGDLFLMAEQQPLLVIDNASGVRDPDIIAALATGAGHQKRQLYADSERVVHEAKTSLVFTSIVSDISQRPDLMDRVLPVPLRAMATSERRLEADLNAAWSDDLPHLLADLLALVASAIANYGNIRFAVDAGMLPPLPRLADAAIAAEAAAQAEGWEPGLLLRVLNSMRDADRAAQLEANPVAVRVRALLDNSGGRWAGTATELLDQLRLREGPPWGREVLSVHTLVKAVDRIVASLAVWGIEVTRGDRSKSARTLTISREAHAAPLAPEAAQAG